MEIEKKEENTRKRDRSGDDDDTDCEGSKTRRKDVMDIASSSSSAADNPPLREKYDVFISFRGEDTRLGITSHLHAALLQKKIETYIDDKLQSGEEIGPALLQAIEKSTISVIIFSQNYASSTWCLDELVHILKCNNREGRMVIPVFYNINPSDVRKQHGSYADAFAQLEKRLDNSIDKVHKWRGALTTAANLSGFHYSNEYGTEADLIKNVVHRICTRLIGESSCNLEGLFGIESHVEQIEELLGIHSQDACITVGIWGMGGIGKTTLAETVFCKLSSTFEASCFLKNVRENSEKPNGLDDLVKTLLKEILKEENLSINSTSVQDRLRRTKVLIVLDDVSDSLQTERLAGNRLRYGSGSRIIITSRDKSTLRQTVEEDKIYEVQGLQPDDALQLFCSRAFKDNSTRRTDFKELTEKVVAYAGHVPLALTVLGSLFFNCKSKEEWEDEFDKLKRFPSEDIQKVLRISYDRLGKNEKEIFLDIACFCKGWPVDRVKRTLASCERFPKTGINILINSCLISIGSSWGSKIIEMHDLLQEMGKTIVQEQCINDPGKRSRLFNDEDVYRVLKNNTKTPYVEAIQVYWYDLQERPLKRADFKKMFNLIMLRSSGELTASLDLPDSLRYLEWRRYALESLPSNFCPENLVELHMPYSKVEKLWKEEQIPVNLQVIDLSYSQYLTEVPNLFGSLKIVKINLRGCESLVEIPSYFQHLDKLTHLDLGGCKSLKYLPEMPGKLPSSSVGFISLEELDLGYSGILEIPASIKQASRLSILDLRHCKRLQSIPELPVLCNVQAQGCKSLKKVSSSRTALTQGWDKPNYCFKVFGNCPRLNNNSRSNIMDEAQITIMRMATAAPFKYPLWHHNPWPQIKIACPGKEIPNWFRYQNEGSSVDIELCPDWFRTGLFGFALSVVVSEARYQWRVRANFIVKFMGESHELFSSEYIISNDWFSNDWFEFDGYRDGKHHVHVWNEAFRSEEVGENCSPDVYKLAKEASVVFCLDYVLPPYFNQARAPLGKVFRCGICPLYAEDAEKFKFGHVFMSRGPKVGEETRQDDHSKGGGSGDEPQVSGFSKFPEILKPMEHLVSLCLEYTAVEMLPSSIGNLNGLQDLNLSFCYLLKDVPTSIYSLTNLKRLYFYDCGRLEKLPSSSVGRAGFISLAVLDLSYSGILEIPASIKQASRLSLLELCGCKRLQSIPELPVLCNVNARGCTSLKILSSSRTALTQGWDKPHYYCNRDFTNCTKLDNNSRSNIMDEAQITIMRMATVAPLKELRFHHDPWPQINIVCPGKEIPNWFSYQNEGSSVDIELCPDWFRTGLVGFALSVVISEDDWFKTCSVRANFIVKFMGESHELFSSEYIISNNWFSNDWFEFDGYRDGKHHLHVWNEAFRSEEVGENCSPDVYKLAKEASVVFCLEDNSEDMKVERCGICPLYAEDAEKFKFGHVFMSRGPKVEEETRQDDDSKGGGSGDEPQVSGSSDESEANESD